MAGVLDMTAQVSPGMGPGCTAVWCRRSLQEGGRPGFYKFYLGFFVLFFFSALKVSF